MTARSDSRAEPHSPADRCHPGAAARLDPVGPDRDNPKVRQILDAARVLFLGQPYDAVSTDAIARQAKVSKATLYVYFASKEILFAALISSQCNAIANDVWRSACGSEPVEEVLHKIARNFMTMFTTSDALSLYRIIVAQVPRFPELGQRFFDAGPRVLQARIADYLAEATRRGQIDVPDAPLAAMQFLHLIAGDTPIFGLLALEPISQEQIDRTVESGIALFMAGYGAKTKTHAR